MDNPILMSSHIIQIRWGVNIRLNKFLVLMNTYSHSYIPLQVKLCFHFTALICLCVLLYIYIYVYIYMEIYPPFSVSLIPPSLCFAMWRMPLHGTRWFSDVSVGAHRRVVLASSRLDTWFADVDCWSIFTYIDREIVYSFSLPPGPACMYMHKHTFS